ncbi:phosphoadenylyl-sulfate reductase [Sediminibacterium soli]|uniref:phosphoadenylyl-sulfate reductase n=1 Tax=Sediminibacterium soli TaxID=2698829 RepID=UPI00137AEBD5|nr:phosphoadenylyl-sulfate reductase [Sediminibacterium soli]NCI46822.1 phosphoadenylyl-sulfate reductase [Sediminibacterium soli]
MQTPSKEYLDQLEQQLASLPVKEALALLAEQFPGQVTFSSSFSFEDQVISHDILSNALPVSVFTLDTGRLFSETYSVWSSTNQRYQTHIKAYYPDAGALEAFVLETGPNSFYESVENRKSCCGIRKVEPLKRALAGNAVWVTGLRAEHSPVRKDLQLLEWDEANRLLKFHPLLHWSTEAVRAYIDQHNIPYNPLHDRGFVSIGCAPCTRAIRPGEDFRAGRWWWEDSSRKECGLHEKQHSITNDQPVIR